MRHRAHRSRSVGAQAVFLAAATGGAQALLAVLYLLAARDSSPQEFGATVSSVAIATAAVGIIDFGTNSHWVREISRGSMDSHELGKRFANKATVAVMLGLLWSLITGLFLPEAQLWSAGPVMLALMINQTSQVSLRAARRGDLVAVTILADRAAAFLAFLIMRASGSTGPVALWLSLVCGSFVAAGLAWRVMERSDRPTLRIDARTNPWSGAGYYGLSTLSNAAQSLDLPVLSVVAGPAAAGLFAAVSRWTQPMSLLASAFSAASAPFVSGANDLLDAWQHVRKAAWMPILAIALSAGVAVAAPVLVPVLLGEGYLGSVDNLRILALVAIFSIMSQPLTVVLQSLGHDRFVGTSMGITVILQLVLVVIMGSALGSVGAALASLVIQIILFTALLLRVRREHREARAIRAQKASARDRVTDDLGR